MKNTHVTMTMPLSAYERSYEDGTLDQIIQREYRRQTGSRRRVSAWSFSLGAWSSDGSWSEVRASLVGVKTHWASGYPILGEVVIRRTAGQ